MNFYEKRVLIFICYLIFSFGANCQKTSYKTVEYPNNYKAQIDVIYTKVDTWEGRMDLYTNPTSEQPMPMVINIHGGGWNHGEKESQSGFGSFF